MSWWLNKVYHFVHIWFDERDFIWFEDRLSDVIESLAEDVRLWIKTAIVFVDEPYPPFYRDVTKIPWNIWRRKRVQEKVELLSPWIPIITWHMTWRAIKKSELFDASWWINRNSLLVQKIVKIWNNLSSIWLDDSTEHFVVWEYLWLCVNNYSDLVWKILWYNTRILEEESLSFRDTIPYTLSL